MREVKGLIAFPQVCPLVTDEVDNDLNKVLDSLDLQTDIDDNCYIDYSLVQPPFVIKDALFVNGKGTISVFLQNRFEELYIFRNHIFLRNMLCAL
jgi:hypothetical protein